MLFLYPDPERIVGFFHKKDLNEDEDGWVFFDITHDGGVHDLYMAYQSEYSRPLRIKIGKSKMFVPVAFGTPESADRFQKEGTVDLGKAGTTRVSFKAAEKWPEIRAISFLPEEHRQKKKRLKYKKSYFGFTPAIGAGSAAANLADNSLRWKRSPTAVTFSFEIGKTDIGADYEYQSVCLQGNSVKFTYGEAHDCMALNGDPIGDQYSGENFPEVIRIGHDHVIKSLALGLSTYTGEAAFHSISLHDRRTKQDEQRVLVGAMLQEPTYVYDREKLGLNLWLTSICAPDNRPVARYGFTLSSDPTIDFNQKEFAVFWEWFVEIKHKMAQKRISREAVLEKMSPLREFLFSSFSDAPLSPSSSITSRANEGWLYATRYHISLTYDVFSLLLHWMPGSEKIKVTFFVDGQQYDYSKISRLEEVPLRRNDILAYAIATAAQDTDLLYQMGLIHPSRMENDEISKERELLNLRKSGHTFPGDYTPTPTARRAMVILAMGGLRKVGSTLLTDDRLGWDIYSLAAQKRSENHKYPKFFMLSGASLVCMLIQILVPILLFYRAVTDEEAELTWDTYIARILFVLYAAFAEVASWELDREDRVVAWLSFFPEYGIKRLILGRFVNQMSKLMTTVATIGLIVNSFTVFDVTLNSLALYYILDLDDNLVDENTMERIRNFHEEEYLTIKSKLALEYRQSWFDDSLLPKIQELPARYFLVAAHQVGYLSGAMLAGAFIFIIFAPWFVSVSEGGFQ